MRGGPFAVTLTAFDAAGQPVTLFNAPVVLSATASGGVIAMTPATASGWTAGVWTGQVTIPTFATGVVLSATDGYAATGASNPFATVTGPLDHFVWDPITSPQNVDTPFTATVRAVDAGGNPNPAFTSTAGLSALVPVAQAPIGTGSYALPTPINPYFAASRTQTIYPASTMGGAKRIMALALNAQYSSGTTLSNWTVRLKHTTQASFPSPVWDNAGWTVVHVSNAGIAAGWVTFDFQTPFDYDGTSNLMVDLSFRNGTNGSISNYCYATSDPAYATRTISGSTSTVGSDPLAWGTGTTESKAAIYHSPNLQFSSGGPVPMRPATTGAFAAGIWTGDVSIATPTAFAGLRADDGAGHRGYSNAFAANAGPAPTTGATIFAEDWEGATLAPQWTIGGTSVFHTQIVTTNGPHGGLKHLIMDSGLAGTGARNETTLTLNLAGRGNVVLSFWAKGFNDTPDGPPPNPFANGADFDGVAISANGATWYEVQGLRTITNAWQQFTVALDAEVAARGLSYNSAFKIRFNHFGNAPVTGNGMAIDDIAVTAASAINGPGITLPASVVEGAGAVAGTVTLPGTSASDRIVTLVSLAPAKVTVPASVTVAAGQVSAAFTATVLDDAILDGNKWVTITATVPGLNPGGGSMLVVDNDLATFMLTAPATATETSGGSTVQGSLGIAPTPAAPSTVTLTSSDPTAATVPATVTIQPGQSTVTFPITVIDDDKIDGPQTTTLTATVPGAPPATATMTVNDNENTNLTLSASSVTEGSPTTGYVYISGTLTTALTVTLTSANPAQLTVPASVTIPAGLTSASFALTAVDDTATDGAQSVLVTAAATGFTSASQTVTAYDNDLHHFTVTASPNSPQLANQSFSVSATASTIDNTTVGLNGSVGLSALAGLSPLPTTPTNVTFSSGSWSGQVSVNATGTGVVLKLNDGAGHTGLSSPFDVVIGALHHFAFNPIGSPQNINVPFPVTVRALDLAGNAVTAFTGSAALEIPAERPVGTATTTSSFPLYSYYHDCRSQVIYTAAELGGATRFTSLALNVTTVPGQTLNAWTIRIKPTTLSAYVAGSAAWETTGWTVVHQSNATVSPAGWVTFPFTAPFDYDGVSNLLIDFSFNNSNYTSSGTTAAMTATQTRMIYAYTDSGYGDPLTWSGTGSPAPNLTSTIPNIRFGVTGGIPLTPATAGAFSAGQWSGSVSVGASSSAVRLRATGGGVAGESNVFDVSGPPTLFVSPAGGLAASGLRSGPFTPTAQTWTLTNLGISALNWTAANGPAWLTAAPSSGTLAAGASINVIATPNAAATALASGLYSGSIAFTNTTSGLGNTTRSTTLTVNPAGDLAIAPAGAFVPEGNVGGPFAPTSATWTLSNPGDAPLNWTAGKTQSWFTLDSAGGTLAPGASTTITAALDPSANAVPFGIASDTITFTNTTTGRGNATRGASLTVRQPGPALLAEPPVTGGLGNTVAWLPVSGAAGYEVQAADNAAWTGAASSGWTTGTAHTFTPLADGRMWRFRLRTRNVLTAPTVTWTQSSQSDFSADTPVNATANAAPGSVILSTGTLLGSENFDEPGTAWASTIFPNISGGTFERTALAGIGPNTNPPLPVNQGGDLEARLTGTNGNAFMADVPANRFADGTIDAYFAPADQNNLHYAGLLLRASPAGGLVNGYGAVVLFFSDGTAKADFSHIVSTAANGWFYAATTAFPLAANENIHARFTTSGSTLSLSLWRVGVLGGSVTETPIPFFQGTNTLTATDSTYSAPGLAGIYDAYSTVNQSLFDDVTVAKAGPGFAASGALTSSPITPAPFVRWKELNFTRTTPVGTTLTVDVLDAAGALLAANVASGTDLSTLPAVAAKTALRLRANFATTDSAASPTLLDWSVTWQTVETYLESQWSAVLTSLQDAVPPTVVITSAAQAYGPSYRLTGTALDANGVAALTVNGVPATSSDGFAHWSAPFLLNVSGNGFSILALDRAVPSNSRTYGWAVAYDTTDSDGNGLPDAWETLHGLTGGPLGDTDLDGRAEILEFALGLDPTISDAAALAPPSLVYDSADGHTYLTWTYRRRTDWTALTYTVEVSTGLATWESGPARVQSVGAPLPLSDGVTEAVTVRALPAADTSGAPRFIRLRVTSP